MPTFEMCSGEGCPNELRAKCLRWRAKPYDVQTYGNFEPMTGNNGYGCGGFMPIGLEHKRFVRTVRDCLAPLVSVE